MCVRFLAIGNSNKKIVEKITRLRNLDFLISRHFEQMPVPADNEITTTRQGTGQKFIIIRIFTNAFGKCWNGKNYCILDYIIKRRFQIDAWMILSQAFSHPPVFIQDFGRDN